MPGSKCAATRLTALNLEMGTSTFPPFCGKGGTVAKEGATASGARLPELGLCSPGQATAAAPRGAGGVGAVKKLVFSAANDFALLRNTGQCVWCFTVYPNIEHSPGTQSNY
jgi:hypothetical protein